jgi:hypothetical protein
MENRLQRHSPHVRKNLLFYCNVQRAIKAILRLVNPSSLAHGLINLFLAKPFGSKNMLQRIFTEGTDIARTERQLREAKRHVTKKVAEKVYNWVQASYMVTN